MIKKRKVTITIDVDTETHEGWIKAHISENGKVKKTWLPSEAVCTANTLIEIARDLLNGSLKRLIAIEDNLNENGELQIVKQENNDTHGIDY